MKKKTKLPRAFAVLAALAAAGAAHAQSSLQVYGIIDAAVMSSNTGAPDGHMNQLSTGNQAGTRLGFRGVEDLGGGLRAVFNIEMGIANDTGQFVTFGEPGIVFGRKSVVGLQGPWGDVYLGRDYTPAWWTIFQTDRFRFGLPGTISSNSGLAVSRASNGIFYHSPVMGGFRTRLAYTFGAESTTAHDRGRLVGGQVEYRAGKLFLSASAQNRFDLKPGSTTETTSLQGRGAGLEYDFGVAIVSAGYWQVNAVTATAGAVDKSRAAWVGASRRFGANEVKLQVLNTRVDVVGHPGGRALTAGVAFIHYLSKRTSVYVGAGKVWNDKDARLALNAGTDRIGGVVFGADPRAVLAGMRHDF